MADKEKSDSVSENVFMVESITAFPLVRALIVDVCLTVVSQGHWFTPNTAPNNGQQNTCVSGRRALIVALVEEWVASLLHVQSAALFGHQR